MWPFTKKSSITKEIKVEGMMCGHCEQHVKKALEEVPGVVKAKADHTTGMVTVELGGDVADAVLRTAIEGAGYKCI